MATRTAVAMAPGMFAGSAGTSDDLRISQSYQASGDLNYVPGRWKGVHIGNESSGFSSAYNVSYGFDVLGRMDRVVGPGLPTGTGPNHGAWYEFEPGAASGENTNLLRDTLIKDSTGGVRSWSRRTYEQNRDLIDAVTNTFGGLTSTDIISKYDYTNDNINRRTSVIYTGAAFVGGTGDHNDVWQYNNRNELTRNDQYTGVTPGGGAADVTKLRVFDYDNIGNRKTSTEGTSPQKTYDRNSLNQYTQARVTSPLSSQRFRYDDDGNLVEMYAASDLDADGDADAADLALILAMFAQTLEDYVAGGGNADHFRRADLDSNEIIEIGDLTGFLSYYGTSNTGVVLAAFKWDGENRLIEWAPLAPSGTAKLVRFVYDHRGRRIEKQVYGWNAGANPPAWYANPSERRRFVWNGWLMLRETIESDTSNPPDGTFDSTRTKTYTWGRDLGNDLESAGGIGGLLSVYDDNATATGSDDLAYVYMYDANGNVGQVVDWAATGSGVPAGALVAKYEYDAYGNVTASGGTYSAANTYRFSTKPWDDETGLGYWGYRYYEPRMGRWINRDPFEEQGGIALYSFVNNSPIQLIDPDGRLPHWIAGCLVSGGWGGVGGFFSGIGGGWKKGLCGAAGGAISGCCSGAVCAATGGILCPVASCICGALGNLVTELCNSGTESFKDPCTWISAGLGGAVGCLNGLVLQQKGTGPMDADDLKAKLTKFLVGFTVGKVSAACRATRDLCKEW